MTQLTLSVVIPAHNEEANLPVTLAELQGALDAEGVPYEIIVVDDNSTDGTADVIRDACEGDARIRGVFRSPPNGFGRAIRAGLEAVRGDAVIVCMADRSDHPQDAIAYYRKLAEGYDCVFGSRFVKGSCVRNYPRLKRLVNRVVNKFIQWIFWCPFNDLTNAFKAYRTNVLRECGPYRSSHFNITIEMSLTALIRRYRIAQIPIGWSGRTSGVSKLRIIEMGRRYLSTLLKMMAERFLIEDDVLAERGAWEPRQEPRTVPWKAAVPVATDAKTTSPFRPNLAASQGTR
ncbi:MAG: glycosyltransferase family 2 protein [Candidatus Anammoximicrobium sp.]|nr:glycosyltransferase family 2 protein [Candidatus Anammoximicrobium sp.]